MDREDKSCRGEGNCSENQHQFHIKITSAAQPSCQPQQLGLGNPRGSWRRQGLLVNTYTPPPPAGRPEPGSCSSQGPQRQSPEPAARPPASLTLSALPASHPPASPPLLTQLPQNRSPQPCLSPKASSAQPCSKRALGSRQSQPSNAGAARQASPTPVQQCPAPQTSSRGSICQRDPQAQPDTPPGPPSGQHPPARPHPTGSAEGRIRQGVPPSEQRKQSHSRDRGLLLPLSRSHLIPSSPRPKGALDRAQSDGGSPGPSHPHHITHSVHPAAATE